MEVGEAFFLDLEPGAIPLPGATSGTEVTHAASPARRIAPERGAPHENEARSLVAPAGEAWTFSPFDEPSRVVTGFALDRGARIDVPADERPSTTGGLVEALDQQDVKLGMGRGGPVKLAIEAAARTTDAPIVGTATFDVVVESSGGLHVQLLSASTDFQGWTRLVDAIRAHLARKQVRIPSGAKGLRVAVEVEAREQYPDGVSPTALGNEVGVSLKGVTASHRNKVCEMHPAVKGDRVDMDSHSGSAALASANIVKLMVEGTCSVENIGARATRVVSSRILRETRL
ncbi:hypothetical protein LVJ94_43195 [Pendulispora rubella]|uniref:Uncharacterized protein n=1 Tax=Pendulispora rubella TaxID=2741070 RepID=A0ABZ2L053_9BACT